MQIIVNGEPRQITAAASIADLLDELRLAGRPVAVERNLELIPRDQHATCQVAEGDCLEIVTLVGGG